MDISHILEQISISISEIEKCTQQFKNQNTISRISVDSALAKTIQVYDSLLLLQRTVSVDTEIIERKNDEGVSAEIPIADSIHDSDETEQKISAESIEIEETTVNQEIDMLKLETPVSKTDGVLKSSEIDVSQKLGKKPVSNIAAAIGINERFQFIKELFQNNVELYTGAIQELNELSSFESALSLLQNKYTLDFDDELVQRFVGIVERRYL